MQDFVVDIIAPLIARNGWTNICEIGSSLGKSTDVLINLPGVSLCVVDPCLDLDLTKKYLGRSNISVHVGTSLEVLPRLNTVFDCILIDGDHNWYTVYHELQCIRDRGLLRWGGIICLHDVEWPYGKRDMYYQPETVPAEYRQPYARQAIVRGRSELSGALGINGQLCNALHEGGPRNGVISAIKDFLRENPHRYQFATLKRHDGLGIIHARSSSADNIQFFRLKCRFLMSNAFTWPKRFARERFPVVYVSLKTAAGRK